MGQLCPDRLFQLDHAFLDTTGGKAHHLGHSLSEGILATKPEPTGATTTDKHDRYATTYLLQGYHRWGGNSRVQRRMTIQIFLSIAAHPNERRGTQQYVLSGPVHGRVRGRWAGYAVAPTG